MSNGVYCGPFRNGLPIKFMYLSGIYFLIQVCEFWIYEIVVGGFALRSFYRSEMSYWLSDGDDGVRRFSRLWAQIQEMLVFPSHWNTTWSRKEYESGTQTTQIRNWDRPKQIKGTYPYELQDLHIDTLKGTRSRGNRDEKIRILRGNNGTRRTNIQMTNWHTLGPSGKMNKLIRSP